MRRLRTSNPSQTECLRVLAAAGLVLAAYGWAGAQVVPNPDSDRADFTIVVEGTFDPETVAAFKKRVDDYVQMRSRLEKGLPPLVVTTDADEIERFEHRLADRIREVRESRKGQVFVPSMERQLKRMLAIRVDAATLAGIMDDGPGEFDVDVNDTYSKTRPLATMPPNILLRLPDLPRDVEYRFVGRHLILRDARANIIIDEIPHAIRCENCVPASEPDAGDDHRNRKDAR